MTQKASVPELSIAICTYNRADILSHCLQSIADAPSESHRCEVLVIDNNSTDHTQSVVESFKAIIPNLRIVNEVEQGHSNARNRALIEAHSDWIFYLDDDAKVRQSTLGQVFFTIENYSYKIFGGVYYPWYLYGRPIWYQDRYASNKMKYGSITVLQGDETVSGGVLCVSKELLREFDGFNPNVGMIGNKTGYWDETELQMRIRAKGYEIAYDPRIEIEHLVPPYKLTAGWFFKASYIKGRDRVIGKKASSHPLYLMFTTAVLVGMPLLLTIKNLPKLLLNSDYYIENWLIDSFHKSAKRIGIVYSSLIQKYGTTDFDPE